MECYKGDAERYVPTSAAVGEEEIIRRARSGGSRKKREDGFGLIEEPPPLGRKAACVGFRDTQRRRGE